ncbi:MAG TPA: hypothetical protein VH596_05870 [Terriglobales bacterium]|jgi:hypothetical protein
MFAVLIRLWIERFPREAIHNSAASLSMSLQNQRRTRDKTFQQISEEFAEIVISKVSQHEGRKMPRVAVRLSVSPKKVRRILRPVVRRKPVGR